MADVIDTSGFTGSEEYYRYPLVRGHVFTEGVKYVADKAGAFWLLDAIFSHQIDPKAQAEEFQVWTLTKLPNDTATLVMTDGNSKDPIIRQDITFTDFPQETMVMWLVNKTLYLPSEH